jgi:hypothetical protein
MSKYPRHIAQRIDDRLRFLRGKRRQKPIQAVIARATETLAPPAESCVIHIGLHEPLIIRRRQTQHDSPNVTALIDCVDEFIAVSFFPWRKRRAGYSPDALRLAESAYND